MHGRIVAGENQIPREIWKCKLIVALSVLPFCYRPRSTLLDLRFQISALSRHSISFCSSLIQHHLITLSALASTFGGIVRPISLAAFRLIMNSNFVGCSTGRSVHRLRKGAGIAIDTQHPIPARRCSCSCLGFLCPHGAVLSAAG